MVSMIEPKEKRDEETYRECLVLSDDEMDLEDEDEITLAKSIVDEIIEETEREEQ